LTGSFGLWLYSKPFATEQTILEKFSGDFEVIQNWLQTTKNIFGMPAAKQMRPGVSLEIHSCGSFDNSDYPTNLRGLNQTEKRI
jgi:hypothetical protein